MLLLTHLKNKGSIRGSVLYAEQFDGESFTPSEQTQLQYEQNFIAKDLIGDEFGQWATGEAT